MALLSPGVQVTVSDESIYLPAAATTVPLFFIVTKYRKTLPNSNQVAIGTIEAGIPRLVTSLRDSIELYGVPIFQQDVLGNSQHGDCRNEYGLLALNQFLYSGNRAYVIRADIDLDDSVENLEKLWQSASASVVDAAKLAMSLNISGLASTKTSNKDLIGGYPIIPAELLYDGKIKQVDTSNATELAAFEAYYRDLARYQAENEVVMQTTMDALKVLGNSTSAFADRFTDSARLRYNMTQIVGGNFYDYEFRDSDLNFKTSYSYVPYSDIPTDASGTLSTSSITQDDNVLTKIVTDARRELVNMYQPRVTPAYDSTPGAANPAYMKPTDKHVFMGLKGALNQRLRPVGVGSVSANIITGKLTVKASTPGGTDTIYRNVSGRVHATGWIPLLAKLVIKTIDLVRGQIVGDWFITSTITGTEVKIPATVAVASLLTLPSDQALWTPEQIIQSRVISLDPATGTFIDIPVWLDNNGNIKYSDNNGAWSISPDNTLDFGGTRVTFPTFKLSGFVNKLLITDIVIPDQLAVGGVLAYQVAVAPNPSNVITNGIFYGTAKSPNGIVLSISVDVGAGSGVTTGGLVGAIFDGAIRLDYENYAVPGIDVETYGRFIEYGLSQYVRTKSFYYVTSMSSHVGGNLANIASDAQRREAIVYSLAQVISDNTQLQMHTDPYYWSDITSDGFEFNIILCPGFPEVTDEMIVLSERVRQEALVIGSVPMNLNPRSLIQWGSQAVENSVISASNNIRSDNRGLVCYYYPHGFTSNLDGQEVVADSAGMALLAMTNSDNASYVWFAPAGPNRGVISGGSSNIQSTGYVEGTLGTSNVRYVRTRLNDGMRDALYSNCNINPINDSLLHGVVVFGQKTRVNLDFNSALDRINVSRLVMFIRRGIRKIMYRYLMEQNDEILRKNVNSAVTAYLHDIKVKRGLYDFAVLCDVSNNSDASIERNELYVNIALKPTKVVEFIYVPITLVRTGDPVSR